MSTVESELLDSCDAPRQESQQAHTSPAQAFPPARLESVVTGTLIGFRDERQTPLVFFPGQPGSAAVAAASIVDLQGIHIGCQVALLFENADPRRPVVMGVLRTRQAWPGVELPGTVELDSDGKRLVVSAKEQLVLRCGSASITLTRAGKILIEGAYVSSRSSGVMRIKGGSVQIN